MKFFLSTLGTRQKIPRKEHKNLLRVARNAECQQALVKLKAKAGHRQERPKLFPMSGKTKKPWYKDGLRFECTQCGDCCSGSPGMVQFTAEEGTEMATKLGVSESEFYELYASAGVDEGHYELHDVHREGFGFDCILLDRCEATGKTWCRAHEARPMQCRTWPFWPDNIASKRIWNKAAKECEGIGRGALVPLRVIQQEAERTPAWGVVLDFDWEE